MTNKTPLLPLSNGTLAVCASLILLLAVVGSHRTPPGANAEPTARTESVACSLVLASLNSNQPIDNEIVITGAGPFSARVVTIDLPRLRLQQVDETLARAWHVQMTHSQVAIGFSACPGPSMKYQGAVLGPDDFALFSAAQPTWHAISSQSQFAIMSLPKDTLTELGVVFAGQCLISPDTMTAQVPPRGMQRLRSPLCQ